MILIEIIQLGYFAIDHNVSNKPVNLQNAIRLPEYIMSFTFVCVIYLLVHTFMESPRMARSFLCTTRV